MYTEEDLVFNVLKAQREETDEITFIDDEGAEVILKIEPIDPLGICTPYD